MWRSYYWFESSCGGGHVVGLSRVGHGGQFLNGGRDVIGSLSGVCPQSQTCHRQEWERSSHHLALNHSKKKPYQEWHQQILPLFLKYNLLLCHGIAIK